MNGKLHCPDCATGTLRVLSDEELVKMFPMSRAASQVGHPEDWHIQYFFGRDGDIHERWAKLHRIGVYCDKCGHFHDMDERSLKQARNNRDTRNKPKSLKIKGYGNYHY